MGYVFIFKSPALKDVILMGYSDDWETRLKKLPSTFTVSFIYKTECWTDDKKLKQNLEETFPNSLVYGSLYTMKEDDAIIYFESIAKIRGEEKNIIYDVKKNIQENKLESVKINIDDTPKNDTPHEKNHNKETTRESGQNEDKTQNMITFDDFRKCLPNHLTSFSPVEFTFRDKNYTASSYEDIIKIISPILYKLNPELFRKAAHKMVDYFVFAKPSNFETSESKYEEIEGSGIYINVAEASKNIVTFFNKMGYHTGYNLRTEELLFNKTQVESKKGATIEKNSVGSNATRQTNMDKNAAIEILQMDALNKKYKLNKNIIYAAQKVDGTNKNYNVEMYTWELIYDWSLILDDSETHKLYFFNIPSMAISRGSFKTPSNQNRIGTITIEIAYYSTDFKVLNSDDDIKFIKYYISSYTYGLGNNEGARSVSNLEKETNIEQRDNESVAKQKYSNNSYDEENGKSEKPAVVYSLIENPILKGTSPREIEYNGRRYKVDTYADLIDFALDNFPTFDADEIKRYSQKEKPFWQAPYISEKNNHDDDIYNTKYNLYISSSASPNFAFDFVRWFAEMTGVDKDSIQIKVV